MTTDARQHFEESLERHRGILFKVANTYCHDPDDRADLVQETIAQLWRAYPRYESSRPFSTWMYRIALNVAISHVRNDHHRRRYAVPLDQQLHDIADEQGSDHETNQRVRVLYRYIGQLDRISRALLLLYMEDHSYAEIADILGISQTNVATRISRLKQRIRTEL